MADAVEDNEYREAAQQLFEAMANDPSRTAEGRAVWVQELLMKWPWLRPNPWMPKRTGNDGG